MGARPMSEPTPDPQPAGHHIRYHALDNLRAMMMLLGIVLHAAISYGTLPYEVAWPYKDRHTSPLCDVFVVVVHQFRMPLFFVMSGFFTAMLRDRRGVRGMLRNRASRLALPFAVAWIVLFPLVRWGFLFAVSRSSYQPRLAVDRGVVDPYNPYGNPLTMHLWFLYFLILFCAAGAVLDPLVRRLGPAALARLSGGFRAVAGRTWLRPLALGALSFLTLLPMNAGMLETSPDFVPDAKVLLADGLFFAFGWALYYHRDLLPTFRRRAWAQIALALLVLLPVNGVAIGLILRSWKDATPPLPPEPLGPLLVSAATGGLIVWLLIFGISGLFLAHFDRAMPRMRYLTDASYWMYLVHLPLVVWLAGLLAPVDLPAPAKLALLLAVAWPILLASYHYGVRSTAIGYWLNGVRHPRHRAPAAGAVAAPLPGPTAP